MGLLADPECDTAELAGVTAWAAERRLRELASDPSLAYCFWLIVRMAQATRDEDGFVRAVSRLGFAVSSDTSALAFISQAADNVRAFVAQHLESGLYGEMASLALRRTLMETIGEGQRGLFDNSVGDLERSLRAQSTEVQFGKLAHRFFGDFLARTLTFFVDREASNYVPGAGQSIAKRSEEITRAVDIYARESAEIMRRFAAEWYSKHDWKSKGRIGREETQGFVAHALEKLRSEVARDAA